MRSKRIRGALLIACTVSLLPTAHPKAQSAGQLSGPVIGYVWSTDAARLHPIDGLLGSATIGSPVSLPGVGFALPLDGSHVLLRMRATPGLLLFDSLSGQTEDVLSGLDVVPMSSAVSSHASAVALLDASSRHLFVVTGMAAAPAVLHEVSLAEITGRIDRMAVSDDGLLVAFVSITERESALYTFSPASGTRYQGTAEGFGAVAITNDRRVVVTNVESDEVQIVDRPDDQPDWLLLAGPAQGISRPVGVATTNDGRIIVASADSGQVAIFDARGRLVARQSCGCELSGMHRLRDDIYRLTDRLDRTVYLLDASVPRGRIYFVPPSKQ